MQSSKLLIVSVFFLTLPFSVAAQTVVFTVDSSYDLLGRGEIAAELVRTTPNLYFYIEKMWWDALSAQEQNEIQLALFDLGEEFRNRIYPILTSTFGQEARPGVDLDERITVFWHQMRQDAGGYFRPSDSYSRLQAPGSNEREMVYLNASRLTSSKASSFLAHEFMHLITFNQKDLLRRVSEEAWLNEARAEYAPTLLGYDNKFTGSNLEMRLKQFLDNPNVSLTEWTNSKADYGAANLFSQYLVDRYGVKILADSLQSSKTGIASLEDALKLQGVQKTFTRVFADWAVTLLANDCRIGQEYCYLSQNLRALRVVPTLYFLPKTETVLSTVHGTSYWSLNWHRFVGGGSTLRLEFEGGNVGGFQVPYVICDSQNQCSVGFLVLDSAQKASLALSDFSQKYNSLTIMPFAKGKTAGFDGKENRFSFAWKVSVSEKTQTETELRNHLLKRVAELQAQLSQLQAQIAALQRGSGTTPLATSCQRFDSNLYFGLRSNQEVRCLQEFLRKDGVYPEGLVTGNFLSLTQAAVIRFQEKYSSEILSPLGLQQGTGYVGQATRAKINQLLAR